MKIWHVLCFASLTVLSVFLLAAGWEFGLEEIVETLVGVGHEKESLHESWGQILVTTVLAALALIVPVLMALKIGAQRQEAQDEVARTAHILKTTFDNMSGGIVVRDADLNLIAFNQRYVDLLDYPAGFIRLGMPFEEIARFKAERGDYGDGEPEELVRERVALRNQMKPDRKEITTARGIVLDKRREPLPGGGYVTTFTDITERKRAKEELDRQSRVIETTFDNMSQGIAVYDAELRLVAFNEKFCDFRGYPPGFVRLGLSFEEMARYQAERGDYGPGDPEEQVRKRVDALRQGKPWSGEHLDSDGRVIFVHRDPLPGGGCVNTFTDITERKQAEAALRESEALKATILGSALDCIVTIDQHGRIIEWNPAAERTFGHSRGAVLGKRMVDLIVPPAMRGAHKKGFKCYLETGRDRCSVNASN
ncbi:MAG: PAS-domain containing protein [Proteobacteria bacterium]|nr:PAS-domain containing protein [Pseudomonadota bacterium]